MAQKNRSESGIRFRIGTQTVVGIVLKRKFSDGGKRQREKMTVKHSPEYHGMQLIYLTHCIEQTEQTDSEVNRISFKQKKLSTDNNRIICVSQTQTVKRCTRIDILPYHTRSHTTKTKTCQDKTKQDMIRQNKT